MAYEFRHPLNLIAMDNSRETRAATAAKVEKKTETAETPSAAPSQRHEQYGNFLDKSGADKEKAGTERTRRQGASTEPVATPARVVEEGTAYEPAPAHPTQLAASPPCGPPSHPTHAHLPNTQRPVPERREQPGAFRIPTKPPPGTGRGSASGPQSLAQRGAHHSHSLPRWKEDFAPQ